MESLKIIPKNQHRKNKSLIYKYCDLSFYKKRENPEKNDKIDYDTTSLKSKNTQSVSTGPEEKVENTYKRSFSKKLISLSLLLNRLSKRKKECLIELNLRRRRKGSTPEKNAIQVINNNNNNKNGKIYEEDSSMNNEMTQANKYKLKSLPPKLYELSYNKYNLSGNSNAVNRDNKFMPKIPNVFINHLMIQESLNINNSNNLLLSATNRIKGKKLTILYYHPKKSVL